MFTIQFLFADTNRPPQVLRRVGSGQSLLEICLRYGIGIPHSCGGICHCTTCHLFVEKGGEHLEEPSRREQDFLKRVSGANASSRLACQSVLLEGKGKLQILLPSPAM